MSIDNGLASHGVVLKLLLRVDLRLQLLVELVEIVLDSVQQLVMLVQQVLNLVIFIDELDVFLLLSGKLMSQVELEDA